MPSCSLQELENTPPTFGPGFAKDCNASDWSSMLRQTPHVDLMRTWPRQTHGAEFW